MLKKFGSMVCLAATLAGGAFLSADGIYDAVRLVNYEPYYFENSWILLGEVNDQATTVFIDVGSPDGEAARFIAANTENVLVYNINTWDQPHSYQQFLSNVIREDVSNKVVPVRMASKEASLALNLVSEVIYIDCANIDAVPETILSWVAHLSESGAIAGNKWDWPEIASSVTNAAAELGLSLSINGNFWFLSKS